MFTLDDERKAIVTQPEQTWHPVDGGFIRQCPTYAISARLAPVTQPATAAEL